MKIKDNRLFTRIILSVLLCVFLLISMCGEKVAKCDGIGWDGENYYRSMQHFSELITSKGYNQYEIRRVLPWGITNVVCNWLDIEVDKQVAIFSGLLYNFIAIVLAVFFFFRISNHYQWKINTEVVGFSLLFFTYPILKMSGYYPVLSDNFGFLYGVMSCCFFVENRKIALIVSGLIGTFIWPIAAFCCFALACLPNTKIELTTNVNQGEYYFLRVLKLCFAFIPFITFVLLYIEWGGVLSASSGILTLTQPHSTELALFACFCSCIYLYYLVHPINISLMSFFKDNFSHKKWMGWGLMIILYLISMVLFHALANSNQGDLNGLSQFELNILSAFTDPFVFIENHFFYFGLGYLLVILCWKNVIPFYLEKGVGYMLLIAMWTLFTLRTEARVSSLLVPLAIIPLVQYLDTVNLKQSCVYLLVLASVLLSRIWFKINVTGMEEAFADENYVHYLEFPAQRYFMYTGAWQNHTMNYIFTAITVVFIAIYYIGVKKNWFIEKITDIGR